MRQTSYNFLNIYFIGLLKKNYENIILIDLIINCSLIKFML